MHSVASTPLVEPASSRARLAVTDSDAIAAVLLGDREMFEVIVRRYNAQLYRAGMAYLRDHAQTEDAMQNAYLKAFLNLSRFRGSASFATWLTRIMINECLMMLRTRKRFVMEALDEKGEHVDQESFVTASEPLLNRADVKAVLEQSMDALSPTQRAVYLLREVQHLSIAETAQSLGISRENVKVSLHRAREGLKTQLMKSAAGIELFDYPATYCDPMTAKVMQSVTTQPLPQSK
jgi:RNA polymerase sigma factor (sigma-70 family)